MRVFWLMLKKLCIGTDDIIQAFDYVSTDESKKVPDYTDQ